MAQATTRNAARRKRQARLRLTVAGTPARPRLAVFRSLQHISAQVIDDSAGHTVAAASSLEKGLRDAAGSKVARAEAVGRLLAERAQAAGVRQVVFDRAGYRYHGRVKSLAEAARAAGLDF
ncbi:MAG TPA: 50S ribosomal protein L18 [Candidatus Limnocylindrales bacterium]|jgi:large subunit ribosomal protein L18|nr:50S ribosomal protein L18 [Candidatus Limnocylindrales bacterium]